MTAPRVYKAIHAVAADLAQVGLAKASFNVQEHYAYRSIDDLLNRLAPVFAKHRLCVLPRVLERTTVDRQGIAGALLVNVSLRVAFDLVSVTDSSRHTVEAFGEALDDSDKGTAKAMAAAYKVAMFQTFCIPVAGLEDADAVSPKLRQQVEPEPVQGWDQWCRDILETIGICESLEAIDRVQTTQRVLLRSLSRERPELYAELGDVVSQRRAVLTAPQRPTTAAKPDAEDDSPPLGAALEKA